MILPPSILDFSEMPRIIGEKSSDRILKMQEHFPNFMANVKEEEKLVILIDIVGFSKDTTRNQVFKIYLFQRYLTAHILSSKFSFEEKIKINHFVPTGDGCYIVAEKCEPQTAVNFLIALISGFKEQKTENLESLSLRASALMGTVVPFFDMARHLNYIGEGMNEASRILSGGQSVLEKKFMEEHSVATTQDAKLYSRNSLFIGDSICEGIEEHESDCSQILRFSDVADKHGIKRNITVLQGIL